jgi:hypothetical protein
MVSRTGLFLLYLVSILSKKEKLGDPHFNNDEKYRTFILVQYS